MGTQPPVTVYRSVVATVVATAVTPAVEQPTKESALSRPLVVDRCLTLILRWRWVVRLRWWLWCGIELRFGFGELFEFAAIEEDATAPGALIDRHAEPLQGQHLRHAPRAQ